MANKIFNLTSNSSSLLTEKEVYIDLNLNSERNTNIIINTEDPADYIAALRTEQTSDQTSSQIIYDPKLETEEDNTGIKLYTRNYTDTSKLEERERNKSKYKLAKAVNIQAVQQSLQNIFTWTPGERILNPEFGTKLKYFLYEGITSFTKEKIISEIKNAVLTWEPRVSIENIYDASTIEDTENNTIHLEIKYRINGLPNNTYSYSYVYTKNS